MNRYLKIIDEFKTNYILQVLSIVIGISLFIVLTRYLDVKEYGIYSLIVVSLPILRGIISLGLTNFVQRDLTGKSEKYKLKNFAKINTVYLFISFIFIFIFILLKVFNIIFVSALIDFYIFVILIFTFNSSLLISYFISKLELIKSNILKYLQSNLWSFFIIIYALFSHVLDLEFIFLIKLISIIFIFFLILFLSKNKKKLFKVKFDKKYLFSGLNFGVPLIFIMIAQWVITASDRYIINFFFDVVQVGYYSYIYSLIFFIFTASSQTSSVLSIYMIESKNKNDSSRGNFLFNALLKYGMLVIFPCIFGFLVLQSEIVLFISGIKYLNSLYIVPVLIFFPLFALIIQALHNLLILKKETKLISGIYLIGLLTNILLNFILIPKLNILGAAIATLFTYIFMSLLFYYKTKDYFKLNHHFLKIPNMLLSSILMALSIFFIKPDSIFMLILTILLAVISYIFFLFLTKSFIKEERDLIKKIMVFKNKTIANK
ncbi:MAG: lipopolysaccharide biosynthesis protein [Promethearchaeota archaeon]